MLSCSIASCQSNEVDHDKLEKIDVMQTTDEAMQDDFTFRLISEKEQYAVGEEVVLYGEIFYQGEKEEVTINHSSSAIFFHIIEEMRGYDIDYAVQDIGLSTTIQRFGEPHKEQYKKSGAYDPEDSPKDFVTFMEKFLEEDGFPAGYYTVKGKTDFSYARDKQSEQQEHINLEATIDFKVVE